MFRKKEILYSFIFWLIIWQFASLSINYDILLPSPFVVFSRLLQLIISLEFWLAITFSLSKVIFGLLLAIILGSFFAYLSIKSSFFYTLFNPIITVFKAVPVASFIILLLVWFSTDVLPIIVCFIMILPIFYTNMRTAFLSVDTQLIEVGKVFKLPSMIFVKHIILPEVIPFFLSASKLSIGLAFKSGIACEIIALSTDSIGEHLYDAKIFLDTPSVFAWTIVIIYLSLLLEKYFILLVERYIYKLCEVKQ